jgi:hypothetical protein
MRHLANFIEASVGVSAARIQTAADSYLNAKDASSARWELLNQADSQTSFAHVFSTCQS